MPPSTCSRAERDAGNPARWRRTHNVFLAATREKQRTKADVSAQAERLWGHLGRTPRTQVDTEPFHLAFPAGNLLYAETLDDKVALADVRLLADDYAPVDTLVFEAAAVAKSTH